MKASVTLMSLLAALAPGSVAVAQPYETPPPAGAPRPAVIPAPFVQTLGNGLRVIVVERVCQAMKRNTVIPADQQHCS